MTCQWKLGLVYVMSCDWEGIDRHSLKYSTGKTVLNPNAMNERELTNGGIGAEMNITTTPAITQFSTFQYQFDLKHV